jgi:hypothetical protein
MSLLVSDMAFFVIINCYDFNGLILKTKQQQQLKVKNSTKNTHESISCTPWF